MAKFTGKGGVDVGSPKINSYALLYREEVFKFNFKYNLTIVFVDFLQK
jgi:hypothetical protein